MSKKRVLITSALPYVNGVKHIGNMVGSLLPADVYARYRRARGDEVLFICGTDEHGAGMEISAQAEGESVQSYCDRLYQVQTDLYRRFNLSFDHFGRTSRPQNHELTRHMALALDKQGLLEERVMKQVYSIDDKRFLADRYIVGTCPNCGYQNARGDQCENCTKLLDPTDLKEPRSAISGSKNLEVRETRHLFLRLSDPRLNSAVRAWLDTKKDWPRIVTSIGYKWLDEGLSDKCITRDLSWGVKVPKPGFENKVFYVWFDAPIGYIAATKELSDQHPDNPAFNYERWWREDKGAADMEYVEFMGKDNIPFHTISFPATLIGTGESWKKVDFLKGFSWMNYYGSKFSTSQKRGVFIDQALELFPADYWRYYLMANAPESDDADFSWELFAIAINKELADLLGNLYSRVHKLLETNFEGKVPQVGPLGDVEKSTLKALSDGIKTYESAMNEIQFRKSMQALCALWRISNEYMEKKAPWKSAKTDRQDAATALAMAVNFLRVFAVVSAPVIPDSCEKIAKGLGLADAEKTWPDNVEDNFFAIPAGRGVANIGILFQKIDAKRITELKAQFGAELAAGAPRQRGKELHIPVGHKQTTPVPARTTPLNFVLSQDVTSLGVRVATLRIEGVTNKKSSVEFEAFCRQEVAAIIHDLTSEKIANSPILQGFKRLHDKVKASAQNAASENLLEILLRTKKLPQINLLVDIYNLVSCKTLLALGAHDVSRIQGNVTLRLAKGDELFVPLGSKEREAVPAGEYCYIDDSNEVICRMEVRQVEKTKVTPLTTDCFYIVQGNQATSPEYIKKACDELMALTQRFCGGSPKILHKCW